MRAEETIEKIKPIVGDKAEKLRKLYLLEDYNGRAELEEAINLIRIRNLNENEILLPPPFDTGGDYSLGDVIYNGDVQKAFKLKKRSLPRHIAIYGTTGSGKTNACFQLIDNLIKDNIPFIITDWKQNYRDMVSIESGKNIKVFTVGKDIAPFHFNPLVPPKGVNPQIYINKLIDVLNHSHFVSYGVDHLLQNSINTVYKECGVYSEVKKTPTFTDVLEVLKKTPAGGRESLWKASALRVMHDLTFGPVGEVFNTSQTLDIGSFLNQQVILELDTLPQTTKTFLVEALLLQIYLYRINDRNRDENLRHMVILEEAHHLLLKQKDQTETIVDIFLREIRETGQGVCLLDQSPSLISNTALSNTNTLIAMQLKHKDDIHHVSKALLLKEQEYFGMLRVGEAIVKTQAPQPFLVRFPLSGISKGTVTDEMITHHMKDDTITSDSANSEHEEKEKTDSPQNKEIRKTDKLSMEETEFLKDIAAHPLSGVSSRYKRLSMSVEKGNETKLSLIQRELIKPVKVPIKTGTLLLLEPTKIGSETAKNNGILFKNTKGGVLHEFYRMKATHYFKEKGYNIRYEQPIGGGKTVDLVIERDNRKTAVEIETGKSDFIENIRKCSHFDNIICIATSQHVEKQVKEKLEAENLEVSDLTITSTKLFG